MNQQINSKTTEKNFENNEKNGFMSSYKKSEK